MLRFQIISFRVIQKARESLAGLRIFHVRLTTALPRAHETTAPQEMSTLRLLLGPPRTDVFSCSSLSNEHAFERLCRAMNNYSRLGLDSKFIK